ncbi:S-adenosyl-L-methionine-dependent methyltransferase [Zopfia rhizophila CBS 207.26]|uniref:S-adenosyl-L-methionine-dependent methyltransferase n=1 Tax=Zopfia rhizophila CBS 207.26 TaxID=1314779 RepID=A0A6A6DEB8_9PEZI|nr:S-adenosyl-L-methionine-dependent methyltransferase [Zopfia rhizophila CBS 207.26]
MAPDSSRIVELSSIIQRSSGDIDNYLRAQGLPSPSFAVDSPPDLPLPPHLQKARNDILEATSELQSLCEGPLMHLTRLLSPTVNVLPSLQAVHRYRIAFNIGLNESVQYEELAKRCDIDVDDLKRIVRTAIANHLFLEPEKGVVTHSAISKLIVGIPVVDTWMGHFTDDVWTSGVRMVDAIQKWPGSQEPQHTGFALNDPRGRSMFDVLKGDAEKSKQLAASMQFLQSAPVFDLAHLVKDLGWDAGNTPSLMVDIGHRAGSPEPIEKAKVPADLEGRLEFQVHNFFTEQPVKGADVYFFRSTFHDWSDKYAVQILRSLIPALKKGAKIIINEVCMPEPNVLPFYHAQLLRGYDLAMKSMFNSLERDADGWAKLFQAADHRFKLNRITCSPGSILAVIEALWEGEE